MPEGIIDIINRNNKIAISQIRLKHSVRADKEVREWRASATKALTNGYTVSYFLTEEDFEDEAIPAKKAVARKKGAK